MKRGLGSIIGLMILSFVPMLIPFLPPVQAKGADRGPELTLAILPFKMNSPEDLRYLQRGIMDMLSSRIAASSRIRVLDPLSIKGMGEEIPELLDTGKAFSIGERLGVDFLIYGSITKIGSAVSLDAKLLDIKRKKTVSTIFSDSKGMDDVIPKISQFARDVRATILGGGPVASKTPVPLPSRQAPAAPLLIPVPGRAPSGPYPYIPIAPRGSEEEIFADEGPSPPIRQGGSINPAIIMSYQADIKRRGYRRSPDLHLSDINGLEIADVDGDGKNETILLDSATVIISKGILSDLSAREVIRGPAGYNLLSVDVADINRNGIPEIYVSNIVEGMAESFVLEYRNKKYHKIASGLPWVLKVVQTPMEGKILLGQEVLGQTDIDAVTESMLSPFGKAYRLSWKKGMLVKKKRFRLPEKVNILGMNLADIDRDGSPELLALDKEGYLTLYHSSGRPRWKSASPYSIPLKDYARLIVPQGPSTEHISERGFVPLRLAVEDLDNDGIQEVLLSKNEVPVDVFANVRIVTKSSIVSLSWDGVELMENWRTRAMKGYISDFKVADVDNDGKKELVVAMLLFTGALDRLRSRGTVIAYDLKF